MGGQHFRAGVVIVVRHPDRHQVLAFERVDTPGAWQLPQGGLLTDELALDAAWRELHEETGLHTGDVALVGEHPEWLTYEWPVEMRTDDSRPQVRKHPDRLGQSQRWFLFEARDADVVPTPDGREFGAWRWCSAEWLINQVVEWRRPAYERVLGAWFGPER